MYGLAPRFLSSSFLLVPSASDCSQQLLRRADAHVQWQDGGCAAASMSEGLGTWLQRGCRCGTQLELERLWQQSHEPAITMWRERVRRHSA
eukprot:3338102-Rhodomonas_salina.1